MTAERQTGSARPSPVNGAGPGYLIVKRVSSRPSEIMHVYFVHEGNNFIFQGV